MSAPTLWIAVPFLTGLFVLFILREKLVGWISGATSAVLSLTALFIPIDEALLLGAVSFKLSPSVQVFGRSFQLNSEDAPLLVFIYGLAALWFFGTKASGSTNRFASLGLMIVALLTASIAVQPFLYAALLLAMAAMLVVPMLLPPYQRAGRGVVRFLIYQVIAMPFILFSGWMLAGVEASPGDLGTTLQAGTMLGLGFAFLFAVFPLYNWIPMLMEEAHPYAAGFLLWALPTFTVIFAFGFLDRYLWLRTSPQISTAIQAAGILMVTSAGIFAALQRHLGRILGYAAIGEAGLLLVLMSIDTLYMVELSFLFLAARGLQLTVWALALSIIKQKAFSLQFSEVQGLARQYPVAAGALIIAHLSTMGFPLLAGFPPRLALWQELAGESLTASFWTFFGMVCLLIAAVRSLAVFVMTDDESAWRLNESWVQIVMLGLGVIGLLILGMLPQAIQPFAAGLPAMFEQLGQ
jgi:formate hydrogenlyase subunit 3/multisubunit Na+/H+ antiporter MnhD subunit